jgi:magnesium-transporting ATPase (P-type)
MLNKLKGGETVGQTRLVDLEHLKGGSRHCENAIRSSKYTWYNFVPRNLYAQFRKLSNFYFLLIAFMQTIEKISISDGKAAMAPPLAFVIFVSMFKDGYEDYVRHKEDDKENTQKALVFDRAKNAFVPMQW